MTLQTFFEQEPRFTPHAHLITGVVCGLRVEEIDDPLMQRIRYLDKLVDELARGKKLTSVLRDGGGGGQAPPVSRPASPRSRRPAAPA